MRNGNNMLIVGHLKDGIEHSNGDAAFTEFCLMKKRDKVTLLCGKSHYDIILNELREHNIDSTNLFFKEIIPFKGLIKDYLLFFHELKTVYKTLKYAKNNKETEVLFLYTTTFLVYFLKLFLSFYPQIKVYSIFHYDFERIDIKEAIKIYKNKSLMFLYFLIFGPKLPLMLPTPKNLKFIVLGENIYKNAIKIVPKLKNELIVFPNIYIWRNVENKLPDFDKKIKFVVPGVCTYRKNGHNLRKILDALVEKNIMNVEFSFTGRLFEQDLYEYLQVCPIVNKDTLKMSFVSNEERDKIIAESDYAIFTYNIGSYKYTASGAFVDAINFEKPSFVLTNDFMQSYFDKFANIGYITNNYVDLVNQIIKIIEDKPIEEYKIQVQNIKNIKKECSSFLKNIDI